MKAVFLFAVLSAVSFSGGAAADTYTARGIESCPPAYTAVFTGYLQTDIDKNTSMNGALVASESSSVSVGGCVPTKPTGANAQVLVKCALCKRD